MASEAEWAPMPGCKRPDRRFQVQRIAFPAWEKAVRVNLAADLLGGYRDQITGFVGRRPEWAEFGCFLREASPRDLEEYCEAHRSESLAFLVLMLTGACNADCPICFTDRRRKQGETKAAQRDRVILEAAKLGARFVYVPGEGEPTIDPHWWDFLDSCRNAGVEAVVFTNGLIFQDDTLCRSKWGMAADEAIERLREYPISFYVKYWTARPELGASMLGLPQRHVRYESAGGTQVPSGLARLLAGFPRDRLGIEVVVERRNAEEVASQIVPFAEALGLAQIVELLQHNGRVLESNLYDPTPEQLRSISPLLSPTSCDMAPCKAVVTSRGFLSPRIAILEAQIPPPAAHIDQGDLWTLLHATDYIVHRRYNLSCLCELEPALHASTSFASRSRPFNIASAGKNLAQPLTPAPSAGS
jgi:hypothetical protein